MTPLAAMQVLDTHFALHPRSETITEALDTLGSMLVVSRGAYARLSEVADDNELVVLEELAHKAGMLWTCQACPAGWTNTDEDEACTQCGTSRE